MTVAITPRLFIALPAYGQINTSQTTSTLMALQRVLMQRGMDGGFGTLSFPDISEIRNIFLTIWYDKVMTSHMLFIDADMAFDPQLILDMIAMDKPLVGALCPKRKLPIEFAGRARAGEVKIINGFMEVDGVGGAIMLVRRDCVDAILAKYPELDDQVTIKNHAAKDLLDQHGVKRIICAYDPLRINGEKFSEDLSFCHRWRASAPEQYRSPSGDVELWANITYPITHVGQHEFTGRYYDHIKDFIKQSSDAPAEPVPLEVQAEMMQAAE